MPVKDYNADPDLNTQISGINIAEGCAPSGINNAIRQLMADVKEESNEASTQLSSLDSTLRALIAEELAKYLPLTGGTITGWLRFLDTGRIQMNSDSLAIYAVNDEDSLGASVTFYKRNAATNAGCIVITPRKSDGATGPAVKVYPDGRVTIADKHFVRSVNGVSATSDGAVTIPVGGVSSVDGATGAVSTASEKSSNYIRLSCGLQICWTTISISHGGGTAAAWTFPKAFSSAPRCTATVIGTASGDVSERNYGWYDNSASSIKIKVNSNLGTGWHCIAVGVWK